VWESDSVLQYYFKQKGERNVFKRNFVSTRIPKGLISPPLTSLNKLPLASSNVPGADRLAYVAGLSYFQTGKRSVEFMESWTHKNAKPKPTIRKLSQPAKNISPQSPSPNHAGRFEPEPWATSDEDSGPDDITSMYSPPAEIKPIETLAVSDDSGLHLKRFSSISKMINSDYNITQLKEAE
jgi:hypothetical protein